MIATNPLANLVVSITGDSAPLSKTLGVVHQSLSGFNRYGTKAGNDLVSGMSRSLARFSTIAAGVGAAAGLALGAALVHAANSAATYTETLNKAQETFHEFTSIVKADAEAMAAKIGVSLQTYMDYASKFGMIQIAIGKTREEAAKLAVQFMHLGIDAASQMNTDYATSFKKIEAAIIGQSKPIRAFGVLVDNETVKLQAATMGLGARGRQLNVSEKAAARMALVQRGLNQTVGDAERTLGTAANQSKKFWGQLENLSITIGKKLEGSLTNVVTTLNEMIGAFGAASKASPMMEAFFNRIEEGVNALGIVMRNWGDLVEWMGLQASKGLLYVDAVIATLKTTFEGLRDHMVAMVPVISEAITLAYVTPIQIAIRAVGDLVAAMANPFKAGNFGANINKAIDDMRAKALGIVFKAINIPVLPEFKAPDFKPIEEAQKRLMDRINAREQERQNKLPGRFPPPGNRKDIEELPEKPAKAGKAHFMDPVEFAKKLQEGLFGDTVAKATMKNTEKAAQQLEILVAQGKVPAAAAALAVAAPG